MTDRQIKIFLAAYFSDLEQLNKLVENQDNLILPCEIKSYKIPFTVFDILQMNLDIWEDVKTENTLKNYPKFRPKEFHANTLKCINYLSDKLHIYKLDKEHYLKIADAQTSDDGCLYFNYYYV